MEKIKGLAINLDLDHMSVDRGLKGLKDRIKSVNAEMRANMSAFDRSDRSVQKYQTRLESLNKKLEVQKQAVEAARKEYEEMVKQHGHGSQEAEKAAREYHNQVAALNNLERQIEKTKEELQRLEREQRINNSGWTKLGNKLEEASNKLKSASERMGKVGSTLTNKITKPALGAASALASLTLYKGFKRLIGIDTARAKLQALGHDAKNVETIMNNALDAVRGTAYGLDEAATAAASAVAAGIKPGKELYKYLTLVGDAAAIAGSDFNEMASIFNKVQTAGRAYTGELNQLADRGIPIFQWLAKEAGKSAEQVREMASKGQISAEMFRKAIDKNIGGAAKTIGEKSFAAALRNIGADIGRIGANFLDAGGKGKGFFSTVKPLLVDFRKWLAKIEGQAGDLGVKFGRAFNNMVDKVRELKSRYDELSPSQQEFIKKVAMIAPAVAVGAGPAITTFSKLTGAIAGTLEFTGKLSKAIGVLRAGEGLSAALATLGPGAVAGLAVAGLTAVGVAVYKLTREKEKAKKVSLDLADSLSNQALSLQESVETFNKLSEKAKISNEELARLNDLNIRISQTSNPAEIEQLQKQYDELAKKSGLSKEELQKLFQANQNIIKQSPDVETSISKQGNEFVKSTKKVEQYIQSLLNLSRQELADELVIAEAKRREILKENKKIEEDIANLNQMSNKLRELNAATEAERLRNVNDRIVEIRQEILAAGGDQERINDLRREEAILVAFVNEGLGAGLEEIRKQREELNKKLSRNDEELQKINALNEQMANIVLKQVGINEEGEKGLAALDKAIEKNSEELLKLEEKRQKTGELTQEEQKRYDELSETVEKQREARDFLANELGIYREIDTLVDAKLKKLGKETQERIKSLAAVTDIKVEEGNIISQLQKKNEELLKERQRLEENRKKQGANKQEIDKQIEAIDDKIWKNDRVLEQILKELGIWDDVKDSIDLGTKRLESQGIQIQKNNKHTEEGLKKERERTKEAGKDVTKKVNVTDKGKVADINKRAAETKNKTINIKEKGLAAVNREATKPVTKKVTLNAVWKNVQSGLKKALSNLKFWEKGTPPSGHPGGLAVVGERGSELITLPDGRSFLSPGTHTLLNLPRGTHVIPHHETKRIIRNVPRYADGTRNWANALGNSEFARLLSLNSRASESNNIVRGRNGANNNNNNNEVIRLLAEQNKLLMQLLRKNTQIVLNERVVGQELEPIITEIQQRNTRIRTSFT